MTDRTPTPTDDELVADLQRYLAATEVDEPPFRTRVLDARDVRRRSGAGRAWMVSGTVVATVAAVVAVVVVSQPHLGGGGASTSPSIGFAPAQGSPFTGGGARTSLGTTVQPGAPALGHLSSAPPAGTAVGSSGLAAGAGTAGPGAAAAPGAPGGSGAALVLGSPGGKVERSVTASYTVPQGSFLSSFDGVISRAVGMGGYVSSSTTSPDGSGRVVAGSVTLKVPSDQLAAFVNGMPSTFQTGSINFASVDHTADFTDIHARLTSAQAQLTALNTLLAKATNLGDIVSLEQQVAQVQAQVDSYQGQVNAINAEVQLSTATIQLGERGAAPAPVPSPNPVKDDVGGGWSNAVAVTGAILGGTITLLPVLALATLLLGGWVLVLRRRRS